MNSREALEAGGLAGATALTRFAFRSHYLYDIDSVNFALALRRFDPSAYQPHPPGYFLYVCLGRLANMLFRDANASLVALSILFSCGAVVMVRLLADEWFGRNAARFAALIFVFSPLLWFHGTVALTYIVEAFFSALVGHLIWRAERGDSRLILPAAIALGVSAGFRPSSILFLGPLFLFSLRKSTPGRVAAGLGALALTILAWLIPMLRMAGARAWFSSLVSLWLMVPGKASVFNSPIMNSLARAIVIAGIYFLCFGCAAILPVLAGKASRPADRNKVIFTWIWIAPGLLFFTFVYLRFVNSGYLLILAPPVCAWMGLWANNWYQSLRLPKIARILILGTCAAVNAAIFICAPLYCSYGAVRRFEAQLQNIIKVLPQIAPAGETMIVGLDSHFLGYRHAGYYLPDYLTIQYPEVRLGSGIRVFAMRSRDTQVQRSLDATRPRNFIIFPLPPNDPDYIDYMAALRQRIPSGDLRVITRDGNEYAIGPAADIHFLFPVTVVHNR